MLLLVLHDLHVCLVGMAWQKRDSTRFWRPTLGAKFRGQTEPALLRFGCGRKCQSRLATKLPSTSLKVLVIRWRIKQVIPCVCGQRLQHFLSSGASPSIICLARFREFARPLRAVRQARFLEL